MMALVKAWLLKLLSLVILVGSISVGLYVVAGGRADVNGGAASVSLSDTLHHLLAGEQSAPPSELDYLGCKTILPAPTRDELDENMRRTLAGGAFLRYDLLLQGAEEADDSMIPSP